MKNYNQFINEGGKLGLPELPVEVAGAMIKIGLIQVIREHALMKSQPDFMKN